MKPKWFILMALLLVAEVFVIWSVPSDGPEYGTIPLILLALLPFLVAGAIAALWKKHAVSLAGAVAGVAGLAVWTHQVDVASGVHVVTFALFHLPFFVLTAAVAALSIRGMVVGER